MADPTALRTALAGRYALEQQLGRGGMATVYRAQDLKHGRSVALKVVHPEVAAAMGHGRFLREIEIAARLAHPNIIPLFDSGEAGGSLWYTMPLIEGESLRDRLKRERQLPLTEALAIAQEVADALSYGHSRGIVHRDIKPENILLANGHALVADFGIARAIDDPGSEQLTTAGIIIGTPGYMSPEQATGVTVDARSDIYSLGCVLYEMLAGEPPFTGPTFGAIAAKQLHDPIPSVRRSRETVSPAVERVLEQALAKVPADRFATASDFAAALRQATTASAAVSAAGPHRRQSSRQWTRILAGAAVVVALVVAGIRVGQMHSDDAVKAPGTGTRIVVLPFASLSADPQDAYFADGITEELSTTLSQVSGLSVIAQTSARGYRDRPIADIARDLKVGSVVEGSVRKLGNRARITVKLVDAQTEATQWSGEYEQTLTDLLVVQSDVAKQVTGRLRVAFAARANQSRPANAEAYDAYLRGLYRMDAVETELNNDSAIALLAGAVALDPSFAPAQAALAQAYVARFFNYDSDPRWQERANLALERAFRLDSNLAVVYFARGNLAWTEANGWRFESALQDYQHALTIEPSMVGAHNVLGSLYFHYGLLEDARRELNQARNLDPLDNFATQRIARTFWYGQQFDSAWAWFSKTRRLANERARVLQYLGKTQEGLALLDSVLVSEGERPLSDALSSYAVLLAASGKRAEAEAKIRAAISQRGGASHFHHAQYDVASAYALLGDHRQAMDWLRRTANNGMPCYPLFAGDPNLNSLRHDPEFIAFLSEQKVQWERYRELVRKASIGTATGRTG